ncbi:MAG: xylulokinase [Acidimicrobiaceae bacterium]|nr:xylulokinase [Acidimicrobiaceae bacterium]
MTLVAGIDSSTQSCKVVVREAESGALVREGRAQHPDGTEVHPEAWWRALEQAVADAGGLGDVAAIAVAGQQHGMVCLDGEGEVVRPALLWNDMRSAHAARELVDELGEGLAGRRAWADAVGSVPVASFTVTKLRWLAEHEPDAARRTEAVCLPHDWLTWRLSLDGSSAHPSLEALATDRGEASGTGYWSPATGAYRFDLLEQAFGRSTRVPTVLAPSGTAGRSACGAVLGAGTGDNAAAALGLGAAPGDVVLSIGTSGTVSAVAERPVADASGAVAGFADATGRFLPLVATVNAARVLKAFADLLGVEETGLSDLACSAPPGAGGLTLVPYLEGERTPNRPESTGALHGIELANTTPAHLARAAVEGVLCGLADALDALVAQGVPVERVILVGGASRSEAVRQAAPAILARPVVVRAPSEHVADGAARQAAWALQPHLVEPPDWPSSSTKTYEADPLPEVRERYAAVRDLTADRSARRSPERR